MFDYLSSRGPAERYGNGFVVAMLARTLGAGGPVRNEWIIVARWGTDGEYISMSWTDLLADTDDAPIDLSPKRTAIGMQQPRPRAGDCVQFQLIPALPEHVTVASLFVPSAGYIRLYGTGAGLRLSSQGRAVTNEQPGTWRLSAARSPWVGEFIEGITSA